MGIRNALRDDEVRIFVNTTELAPAGLSLAIMESAVAALQLRPGPYVSEYVISEMGQNTWWVHILLIGGGIGAVAAGVEGLTADIREGQTPLSQSIAQLMDKFGGSSVIVASSQTELEIARSDIPLEIQQIDSEAQISAHSRAPQPGNGNGNGKAKDEYITITRTTGRYPKTSDGRLVDMIDGSVIFGTQTVPRSNVRFLETPNESISGTGPVGIADSMQLVGGFDLEAETRNLIFRSGGMIFRAELTEGIPIPPLKQPIYAQGRISPIDKELLQVTGWDLLKT